MWLSCVTPTQSSLNTDFFLILLMVLIFTPSEVRTVIQSAPFSHTTNWPSLAIATDSLRLSKNLQSGFPSRPPQEWRHDLNFGYIHFLGGCRYNCQVVGTNSRWSKRNLILALLKRTDLAVDCLTFIMSGY